ncbi:MAG: hypothetical protein NZZ41_02320 [Candidatus Dojkabacteria bacterium]|nr:hypothetical protein [Candidatus Dojkabacteria bacterium]
MSEILIPEKVLIRNNTTKYPLRFLDNSGTPAPAATATQLDIMGFGRFPISRLSNAKLNRGFAPRNEKWVINASTATEITLTSPVAGAVVVVELFVESTRRQFVLARPEYEFGRLFSFQVRLSASETTATFLAKLYNSIMVDVNDKSRELIVKSGSGTAGTFNGVKAVSLTKLELEVNLRGAFIKWFKVSNVDGTPSNYVTVFKPTLIQSMSPGIGYGSDIEFKEKVAGNNNVPYYFDFTDIPYEEALYTEISFDLTANTQDPQSSLLSKRSRFVIYLNEGSCESEIDNLADFFNQLTGANKVYNAIVSGTYTYNVTAAQFKTNA